MNELENNNLDQEQEATQISKREQRRIKNEQKNQEKEGYQKKASRKKNFNKAIWIIVIIGIIGMIGYAASNKKFLPPTTMEGHVEKSPESHIITQPMDIRVHKHMLEHSDGSGPPGVIINYNCDDFNCEPDLITNLVALVEEYPEHVYLAPFPNMASKLTLSALGRQETLENFDETRIREFINR